jgi:hypothetical protein
LFKSFRVETTIKLKNMSLVLDIQGFKIENNKLLIKELAAFDGEKMFHYLFKAPFPFNMLSPQFQKQALWLTKNHHGLDWNAGFVPLHKLGKILQDMPNPTDTIYVKGREKADYIRKFVQLPVVELPEQPVLQKDTPKCFYHCENYCFCALSNVYFLYDTFCNPFNFNILH